MLQVNYTIRNTLNTARILLQFEIRLATGDLGIPVSQSALQTNREIILSRQYDRFGCKCGIFQRMLLSRPNCWYVGLLKWRYISRSQSQAMTRNDKLCATLSSGLPKMWALEPEFYLQSPTVVELRRNSLICIPLPRVEYVLWAESFSAAIRDLAHTPCCVPLI